MCVVTFYGQNCQLHPDFGPLSSHGGPHDVVRQAKRRVSKAWELPEEQRREPPNRPASAQGGHETSGKARGSQ